MYCLKVSLRCIHWSPPFALRPNGDQRKRVVAGVRAGCVGQEGWIVEKRASSPLSFSLLNEGRRAPRISCFPRVPDFLALTKYKWARSRREEHEKSVAISRTRGNGDTDGEKEEEEEGKEREGRKERRTENGEEIPRGDRGEMGNTGSLFLFFFFP